MRRAPREKPPQISPIFKADTVRLHVSREKDGKLRLVYAASDDHMVVQPDGCGQARRGSRGRILPPRRGNPSPPQRLGPPSGPLVKAAAATIGVEIDVVRATDSHGIEEAFVALIRDKVHALVVGTDPFFYNRRVQLATLATRHALPTIYNVRAYAEAGGLMSYGTSLTEAYRQMGVYTARILKGEKPIDLPVVQSTKFDFVINLPTARALGLTIPPMLLARADEVIE